MNITSIESEEVCAQLVSLGFGPAVGVPDSTLAPLQAQMEVSPSWGYVAATHEGEAMGIAAGWALAGRTPVVLMQNSGLGNVVNPLTSLHQVFRLPALLMIGWRGQPGSGPDAVEHEIMGERTIELLNTLRVAHMVLDGNGEQWQRELHSLAKRMMSRREPVAVVVPAGRLAGASQGNVEAGEQTQVAMSRSEEGPSSAPPAMASGTPEWGARDAIRACAEGSGDEDLIVATTGYASRLLYEERDSPRQFYVVGSMGCTAPIALGVATQVRGRRVMAMDGDGALLMRLGSLATVGHYHPENLLHLVLNNRSYASTGGQACVSQRIDLAAMAMAAGYEWSTTVADKTALEQAISARRKGPGLVDILVGGDDRPVKRPELAPEQLRDRFMAEIARS